MKSESFRASEVGFAPGSVRPHIEDMVAGWTIRVTTPRIGEDASVEELFYVAEPNSTRAKSILCAAKSLVHETVELVRSLSENEIAGLGLESGQWMSAP